MTKWTTLFLALTLTAFAAAPAVDFQDAKIKVGAQELKVQVAQSDAARERGLMNRTTVAPWDGMIFVFGHPQPVWFWMKNTLIPLQVGYFDETGTLREIHSMKAQDLTPIRSEIDDVKYALELPTGDFEKRGLKIGDKMNFEKATPGALLH